MPALAAVFVNRRARVICGTTFSLVLFAAVCVAGYAQMFNQYALYDDSGTFLLAFDGLTHGRGLYDEVILPYGPFFFQVFQPVFEVVSPTTNHARLIVLALGLFMVVLVGGIVWMISRSVLLSMASLLVSGTVVFSVLANEPMHPVVLVMVLSLSFVATILPGQTKWPLFMGVLAGVLIGGLIMTKINLGGYAALAVVFAAVSVARFRYAGALRLVAAGFFVLLPFLVASRSLGSEDTTAATFDLLLLVSISMVPIVSAGFRIGASLEDDEYQRSREWLRGVCAGAAGTIVLSTAIFLATGGRFSEFVNGALVVPARWATVFASPLDLPVWEILFTAIAAVAWFTYIRAVRKTPALESHWPQATLRIATGCMIWISLALVATGSLDLIVFPAAMAWVVLMPLPGDGRKTLDGIPRLVIASFAVIGLLGAYPIAGTQLFAAAFLFIPVGALCLADGMSQLKLALGSPDANRPARDWTLLAKVAVLVLVTPFFASNASAEVSEYRSNVPTTLAGSSRLRLLPAVATQLEFVVTEVKSAGCTSLVTQPPSGSIVIWSGLSRSSPMAFSNWLSFLDDEQQNELVAQASQPPRPCFLRADETVAPGTELCAAGAHPVRVQDFLCGDSKPVIRLNGSE